jgi:hypothetical protein
VQTQADVMTFADEGEGVGIRSASKIAWASAAAATGLERGVIRDDNGDGAFTNTDAIEYYGEWAHTEVLDRHPVPVYLMLAGHSLARQEGRSAPAPRMPAAETCTSRAQGSGDPALFRTS